MTWEHIALALAIAASGVISFAVFCLGQRDNRQQRDRLARMVMDRILAETGSTDPPDELDEEAKRMWRRLLSTPPPKRVR